jgi:hypothetical protein
MSDIWLGLGAGIVFGFIIQRIGATNPQKMALAHLMKEPHVPRFMLLAVLLAAAGVLGLQAENIGTFRVLPTSLVATGLGGLIFGIGWGLSGYCPGTCWAAVGEGRLDAVFALLGGLAGTAVFAHLHETLIPVLYSPTNMGQITLIHWLGSPAAALGGLVLLFGGCILLIGRFWRDSR